MYKTVLSEGQQGLLWPKGAVLKNLPCILGFPGGSVERICLPMQQTWVQSLDWEDFPWRGNNNPLQYSCLNKTMDKGAWWASPHGVKKE